MAIWFKRVGRRGGGFGGRSGMSAVGSEGASSCERRRYHGMEEALSGFGMVLSSPIASGSNGVSERTVSSLSGEKEVNGR